jgi:hypothetical protein
LKTHKLFIKLTFLFTLTLTITFGVMVAYIFETPQSALWVNNSFLVKDRYAKTINTSKIVFTSGSNTLFGVDTVDVEKELKIPTVNMAIHAGLTTDYILHRTKKILKDGDVVIIPFEYESLIWDGEQNEVRTQYILTHDREYYNNMNIYEQLSMLYSVNLLDFLASIREKIKNPVKREIGKGYNSDTLNTNGDETYKNGTKSGFLKTYKAPFKLTNLKETIGLVRIKDFSLWCKKNNIKLFITYPNIINNKEYYQDSYLNYFNYLKKYFNENNIEVIGTPHDSMYPLKYFYDTSYHMNTKGSKIRTKELINIIKSKI